MVKLCGNAIVAVDARGNVASIVHSCNCLDWGTSGISVDGVLIPDSASFQQAQIARAGPGARLPDGTNPLIVLSSGKPVLASSAIGVGLLEATVQNLINVLDFHMDPEFAARQPNSQGPFLGMHPTGPMTPELEKEAFAEGSFSDDVLAGLRSRGQPVKVIPDWQQNGYWIGIRVDPSTHQLTGGVTSKIPAMVQGY